MDKLFLEDITDVVELDVEPFPVVEDLVVRLVEAGSFGSHFELASDRLGRLAWFPWWDHARRALGKPDFRIPLGSAESPYEDLEQGWQIVIWEAGGWVMVMEGDDVGSAYDRWFRVRSEDYSEAWQGLIEDERRRRSTPPAHP